MPLKTPGGMAAPNARAKASIWIPAAGSTYAIQYGGSHLDTSVPAAIYDVDGFDTPASTVAALHKAGRHVVCYIDVGTWENWRPDAKQFPSTVLGEPDAGWPGERWLDVRQLSALEPIMTARFRMCKNKGFDAVNSDNIDGWENDTGFPIKPADSLTYDTWVAGAIHALGLSAAEKNDNNQVDTLRNVFDWAQTEQCYAQHYCSQFAGYTRRNRLVVDIEYGLKRSIFTYKTCPTTAKYREVALLKHLSLDAWVVACP